MEEEGKLVVSQRLLAAPATAPFKRGSLVQGRVTGVRPYGVFIELDNGQVGLLHISQISNLRLSAEEMEGLFAMEERVSAVMMEFDREQGRMALSTKLLELQPGDMVRNKAETQKHAEANLARYKLCLFHHSMFSHLKVSFLRYGTHALLPILKYFLSPHLTLSFPSHLILLCFVVVSSADTTSAWWTSALRGRKPPRSSSPA